MNNTNANQSNASIELNDENYKKIIENGCAIVDFWAPWCGPCRMFSPVFESTALLMSEKNASVKFCKVNIDESPNIAAEYSIRSIPTILFIKDGQVIHTRTGFCDSITLQNEIKSHFEI